MRVVVFGASGGVGRELVRQAVGRGHGVRAVYRRLPEVPSGAREDVELADLTRAEGLSAVVEGCEAVLSAVGIRRRVAANPWSALASPATLTSDFATALCEAMRGAGVRRLVFCSAAGVADSAGMLSWAVRKLFEGSNIGLAYEDLGRAERVIAGSGLDYCVVRPTTLTYGRMTCRVVTPRRYGLLQSISRADVAWAMLEAAEAASVEERAWVISRG